MKKILYAAGTLLLLVSCVGSATREDLTGYWLESLPAGSPYTQGFRLDADGGAASIGMHTLVYTGWTRQDDRLILRGQSLGNGQTIEFSDTLAIVRLDADTMTLQRSDRQQIDYVRTEESELGDADIVFI